MKVNGLFHSLFFKNEIFHSGKTLNQTIHAFRWVRGNAGARGEWREGEASGAHLGGAEVERRLHAGRRLWQAVPWDRLVFENDWNQSEIAADSCSICSLSSSQRSSRLSISSLQALRLRPVSAMSAGEMGWLSRPSSRVRSACSWGRRLSRCSSSRSEERRVGEEGRTRWSPEPL